MVMKKIVTSALLALSILGGLATVASAAEGDEFGTRTTPEQKPSPY
jgi:hypothetical protein